MKAEMKNIPQKIYLQVGEDISYHENGDFKELEEVRWCADKINDTDIEYVLAASQRKPYANN
jgi:hypothetical protein